MMEVEIVERLQKRVKSHDSTWN